MNTRTCTWPDCSNKHDSRGYCNNHAKQAIEKGLIEKLPDRSRESLRERFFRIGWLETGSGCWEWAGLRFPKGYGCLNHGGRNRSAHRVSHELHLGPIPKGLVVMHSCDNPPCVNPAHLSTGTTADNIHDMTQKGRANLSGLALGRRGSSRDLRSPDPNYRNPAARLTAADVTEFRHLLSRGASPVSLARTFGISKQHAGRIARGTAWRNVP